VSNRINVVKSSVVWCLVLLALMINVYFEFTSSAVKVSEMKIRMAAHTIMARGIEHFTFDEGTEFADILIKLEKDDRSGKGNATWYSHYKEPILSSIYGFGQADKLNVIGKGRFPTESKFKFVRYSNESKFADDAFAKWSTQEGNDKKAQMLSNGDRQVYRVEVSAGSNEYSTLLFVRKKEGGSGNSYLGAEDYLEDWHVVLDGSRDKPQRNFELKNSILIAARDFDVVSTDVDEAFRKAIARYENRKMKIPVLDIEVEYIYATLFLLLLISTHSLVVGSNMRQLALSTCADRNEPWIVIEKVPKNIHVLDSAAYRIESVFGRLATLLGIAAAPICFVIAFAIIRRMPFAVAWLFVVVASMLFISVVSISSVLSLAKLVRGCSDDQGALDQGPLA
jgi:hypothetical protein